MTRCGGEKSGTLTVVFMTVEDTGQTLKGLPTEEAFESTKIRIEDCEEKKADTIFVSGESMWLQKLRSGSEENPNEGITNKV